MNIEELRNYCLSKKGVDESFPFDEDALVFKVMGKMFLISSISSQPLAFSVKCDPDHAIALREQYSAVTPGYHMNKQHWNTVLCDGSVNKQLLLRWIDDSYTLVVKSLPKKVQSELIQD